MNTAQTNFDSYKLEIETLSPLHIGSDKMLSSVGEFIITSNNIRYLDTHKVSKYLYENEVLDDYTDKIIRSAQGFNTLKILEALGLEIENYITNEIDFATNNINVLHNNVLHTFIEANECKYIPGSSVKGMIKTALLHHYLIENKNILQIENKIKSILDKDTKDFFTLLKQIWESLEKEIFEKKQFNFLRITDSPYLQNESLQVEQLRRQHLLPVDTEGLDWLAETVRAGVSIPLRMQILPQFSQNQSVLNIRNSTSLFTLINNFSSILIDFEIVILNNSSFERKNVLIAKLKELKSAIDKSENNYAICRLGKGKTVYFNTFLSLLSSDTQKRVIKKVFKTEDGSTLFPATRVLTANDKMMGWIRITETEPKFQPQNCESGNKVVEIIPAQNIIKEIKIQDTILNVTVTSPKTVCFFLNQEKYDNIQLINPLKKGISVGDEITCTVWQLTKSGIINQVKIEDI